MPRKSGAHQAFRWHLDVRTGENTQHGEDVANAGDNHRQDNQAQVINLKQRLAAPSAAVARIAPQ